MARYIDYRRIFYIFSQFLVAFLTVPFSSKDKEFYILIMQSTTGDFKYPSIEKGWYTVKEHKYWVFKPGEWARLRYLKDRQDNYVIMLLVDDGYEVGAVDLEKLRKNLKLDDVEKRLARNDEFPVLVYPIEDKQLIQFRLNVAPPATMNPGNRKISRITRYPNPLISSYSILKKFLTALPSEKR